MADISLCAIAENARIPVDNPATHLELTMVHEAMVLEYSGRHLAMIELAAALQLLLYMSLIACLFVPWGLARMVGEWHFYHVGNDVSVIPDEHWYMRDYYCGRNSYRDMPQYPLKVVNAAKESYVQGPLEDWINGALELNGRNQYAYVAQDVVETLPRGVTDPATALGRAQTRAEAALATSQE